MSSPKRRSPASVEAEPTVRLAHHTPALRPRRDESPASVEAEPTVRPKRQSPASVDAERTAPIDGGEVVDGGEVAPSLVARDSSARQLTDPQTMRALAHPTRLALIEALTREGPLTATEAANLLDDSPGNISWHLQTLAKYGFIEETGTGRGRSRPWRLVSLGARFTTSAESSAGVTAAADALASTVYEQSYVRLQEWRAARGAFGSHWRESAFMTNTLTYLTPEELDELGEQVSELLRRYVDRTLDRSHRPAGALPVQLTAWGHPLVPNPSGN